MEKKKFYFAKWKCRNCEAGYPYNDNVKVPKGEEFEKFSKRTECPECGCKGTIYFYGLAVDL